MSAKILNLQAEITGSLEALDKAYRALYKAAAKELDEDKSIVVSYYLHALYGLIENIFVRIASASALTRNVLNSF
jgi:hypothetical protein